MNENINPHFRYNNIITNGLAGLVGGTIRLPFKYAGDALANSVQRGSGTTTKFVGGACGITAGALVALPLNLVGCAADCMRMAGKGSLNAIGLREPSGRTEAEKISIYKPNMMDMRKWSFRTTTGVNPRTLEDWGF